MTNIAKLKQEAEAAFSEAEQQLHEAIDHNDAGSRDRYNRAIVAAMIAQMAVQAAEKEAEAHKYDPAELSRLFFPIADDGWHDWTGGVCPVHNHTIVKVRLRDGGIHKRCAENFRWHYLGDGDYAYGDIIAYRIISPAADRIEE